MTGQEKNEVEGNPTWVSGFLHHKWCQKWILPSAAPSPVFRTAHSIAWKSRGGLYSASPAATLEIFIMKDARLSLRLKCNICSSPDERVWFLLWLTLRYL